MSINYVALLKLHSPTKMLIEFNEIFKRLADNMKQIMYYNCTFIVSRTGKDKQTYKVSKIVTSVQIQKAVSA